MDDRGMWKLAVMTLLYPSWWYVGWQRRKGVWTAQDWRRFLVPVSWSAAVFALSIAAIYFSDVSEIHPDLKMTIAVFGAVIMSFALVTHIVLVALLAHGRPERRLPW
jgi:hypothetical protein